MTSSTAKSGISLIEILIALVLVVVLIAILGRGFSFFPDYLSESVEEIERDFRLAQNESILRGSIVRLQIDLSKAPAERTVQYGPREGFILPQMERDAVMSLEEQQQLEQLQSKIDQQFLPVEEFQDGTRSFHESIMVIGVANGLKENSLVVDQKANVYFYATGERDNALVLLTDGKEIATIELFPFTENIRKTYYRIGEAEQFDDVKILEKAKEIYQTWRTQDQ